MASHPAIIFEVWKHIYNSRGVKSELPKNITAGKDINIPTAPVASATQARSTPRKCTNIMFPRQNNKYYTNIMVQDNATRGKRGETILPTRGREILKLPIEKKRTGFRSRGYGVDFQKKCGVVSPNNMRYNIRDIRSAEIQRGSDHFISGGIRFELFGGTAPFGIDVNDLFSHCLEGNPAVLLQPLSLFLHSLNRYTSSHCIPSFLLC